MLLYFSLLEWLFCNIHFTFQPLRLKRSYADNSLQRKFLESFLFSSPLSFLISFFLPSPPTPPSLLSSSLPSLPLSPSFPLFLPFLSYSFHKYLLSTYSVLGSMLGSEALRWNMKQSLPQGPYNLDRDRQYKQ